MNSFWPRSVNAQRGRLYADDKKLRLAWKAFLAELSAMQMAEHPYEAVVAERLRE